MSTAPNVGLLDAFEAAELLRLAWYPAGYSTPSVVAAEMHLSDLGEGLCAELVRLSPKISPHCIRQAVYESFAVLTGDLVKQGCDVASLRDEISNMVLARDMYYPYVFGREMHDRLVEVLQGRRSVSGPQAQKILAELPIGVFQVGSTVTGPLGLMRSETSRSLWPTTRFPGMLCPNPECDLLHDVELVMPASALTRARHAASEFLDESGLSTAGDKVDSLHALIGQRVSSATFGSSQFLIETVADGLSLDEVRLVGIPAIGPLLGDVHTRGLLEQHVGEFSSADELASKLDLPTLLQLLLCSTDQRIAACLDAAVAAGRLALGEDEVRTGRVSRFHERGAQQVDVGRLGVRYHQVAGVGGTAERCMALLHHIYFESSSQGPDDLRYLLGSGAAVSDEALLGQAVQTLDPEELLMTLVLNQRKTGEAGAALLGASWSSDRDALLERMLWKLGVASARDAGPLTRLQTHVDSLRSATEIEDEAHVRGVVTNLFTAVEDVLSDALTFLIWAMTTDHYSSAEGFVYSRKLSNKMLEKLESTVPHSDPALTLRSDGRNTIVPLAAGFSRLRAWLAELDPTEYVRPMQQTPVECQLGHRPFAFPSRMPFLNLREQAREGVLDALQMVARSVQAGPVLSVRNSVVHGNNQFPSQPELAQTVESMTTLGDLLIDGSIYPRPFKLVEQRRDALGREELAYEDAYDQTVTINLPGWSVAPRLPEAPSTCIILAPAQTSFSGPLRFLLDTHPRPDPYWEGWPARPAPGKSASGVGEAVG